MIKTKVGVLALARQLGNVSQACTIMGDSRDSVDRFKELYDTGGEEALREIVAASPLSTIVWRAISRPPSAGAADRTGGVRCVWVRHDLTTMQQRVKALDAKVARTVRC